MAIFDNNLKPEEEFGAFIPGSQDDDSFYLEKLSEYGGVLPDFTVEDAAISDVILEQLNPEAIAERKERKSNKNNRFGADYNPNAKIEEKEELEEFPTYEEDLSGSPVFEGEVSEAPKWGDDYFNSSPEESLIEEDEELNFATEMTKDSRFDSLVDDDLKKLLKAELARSEERKLAQAQEEQNNFDDDELTSKRLRELGGAYVSPFGEVASFEEHPEIMDFEEIHAESPSTYGLKELSKEEQEKAQAEEQAKAPKQKKKRKPMPLWQIIGLSAAAVLIIGTLITLGVIKFINDPTFMRFGKGKSDSINVAEKAKPKEHKKMKVVESKEEKKDVVENEHKEVENPKVEEKHDEPEVKKEEIKEVPHKEEPRKENKTIKIAEPDKKIETKKPQKAEVKEKPIEKKNNKKVELIAKEEKKVKPKTEKKIEKKEEKIAKQKEESKKETSEEEENVKPSFAVQIYATPSKEDAEDWARKLKQKSVKNVRIDTQLIRDIKWFRVRFGDFENKEEAKSAALKLGFAQSWIDRVR